MIEKIILGVAAAIVLISIIRLYIYIVDKALSN